MAALIGPQRGPVHRVGCGGSSSDDAPQGLWIVPIIYRHKSVAFAPRLQQTRKLVQFGFGGRSLPTDCRCGLALSFCHPLTSRHPLAIPVLCRRRRPSFVRFWAHLVAVSAHAAAAHPILPPLPAPGAP